MAVIISIFLLCCMVVLFALATCDAPIPTPPQKTVKKRKNTGINTYGKYNQAKRYYGYSRGRKFW